MSKSHPFIPNTSQELRKKMLEAIGVATIDELYSDIPREVLLNRPLKVDGFYPEQEVRSRIEQLLNKNKSAADYDMFLGAGIYNHYIPAAVKTIMARTEFQTSYTPYQPEISQGLLQTLFEFESMIRDLTGVEAVNSSLYDGSTALGEAARMAVRVTSRYKILVPRSLHPDKLSVLRNYTEPVGIRIETFGMDDETGCLDLDDLKIKVNTETAAVLCEVPSFFGILDPNAVSVPSLCHEKGALSIIGFDPISLGGLKPPGDYGADIVIAEGQSISSEMNFGGPGLGIIGCKGENLLRQMPGRLIGMTTTMDGKNRAFSMVLQTREQHIRREKATSNICTNEALLGVGAAAYLSLLGPKGLSQLFETILVKTNHAIKRLHELPGTLIPRFTGQHYQEFVVTLENPRHTIAKMNQDLLAAGIHGGKSLVNDFPELGQSSLMCVTETHSPEAIDKLRATMEKFVRS
ncbi:aminomethyl-transferring glycine dehydrogenase subunit GcvPA [Candidatus Bathyarchaeota archaeon]|nr:MAG: aminomethyl-transferring glycine dehydrogenase subunit GcvPA [Candidatus Bathyarchaeota archaeon]